MTPSTPSSPVPRSFPSRISVTPRAVFGFNSQTFNRPYGIQPMFASEKDSAGNTIEMSISDIDPPLDQDQLYKYYKDDGLVQTVDAEGNEVVLNINDIQTA